MNSRALKSIFSEALLRPVGPQRAAYLDDSCRGDGELRAEVSVLLQDHERIGRFMGTATGSIGPPVETNGDGPGDSQSGDQTLAETAEDCEAAFVGPLAEGPGAVVGPYKLLQSIGDGGMGTVYMAEQTQPVRRTVAVKLIKPGMDSRQVLARFGAERQALALMDHPNIAKVFDAGTTGAGRPYFVMELVKGIPITRFCDERRLTVYERLELAIPVCHAVQHAHQKGIIHRDLKPSNVLIALYDGKPVPKVIDFGVAKATGPPLTDQTMHTEFGAVVGTLEYMSPEQAELNQLDIDTRSDVYSLGVLLYELLTGSTPLASMRLKGAVPLELLRMIREDESPRPSVRLSTTEELPSIASRRHVEPRRLSGLVRGELDWIVMKALEKDRNRRYETANGLAGDLRRYLDDEPVEACPPSVAYRFRKFARRNKTRLAIAGLILFCLVLVGGGGCWIAGDKAARRARAAENFDLALEDASRLLEDGNAPAARAAAQHAAGLLAGAGGDAVMQKRLKQVEGDLEMIASLEWARLQKAQVKHAHFDHASAEPVYAAAFRAYNLPVLTLEPDEAARRIARSAIGEKLLAALLDWTNICTHAADHTKLAGLIRLADRDPWRLALFDAMDRDDHPGLVHMAQAPAALEQPAAHVVNLGDILARFDLPSAVELLRQAQARHPDDFWINHQLALYLKSSKPPRLDEAIGFYRAAVAVRPGSPGVHFNLGNALASDRARLAEAEAEYREAIRLKPDYSDAFNTLGSNLSQRKGDQDAAIAVLTEAIRATADNAFTHSILARALLNKGRLDEAIAAAMEAIRLMPDLAVGHNDLGRALYAKRRFDEAIAAYNEAIRLDPEFAQAFNNLGLALSDKGRQDEAIAALKQAIRINPNYVDAHNALGTVLRDLKGDPDAALAAFTEAVRVQPASAVAHGNLGNAFFLKGRLDEAIAGYKEAVRLKPDFAIIHMKLGDALKQKGRPDEAIAAYQEAVRVRPTWPYYRHSLGIALTERRRLDEAIVEFQHAVRLKPDYAVAHANLGNLERDKGRLDEAIASYKEAVRLQPDLARCHSNLGAVLAKKGRLEEAIDEFKLAVGLEPGFAESHCDLGNLLLKKGQFRQAVDELRAGHQLGSRSASWRWPSEKWLSSAELQADLDARLPKILKGDDQPADARQRLALARLCQAHKALYATSVRWFERAFAEQPALADDLRSGNRFSAACAAALAGSGQSKDAPALGEPDRARFRHQALDWLRADLAAWSTMLEKNRAASAPAVRQVMKHWLADSDLAGVRGAASLAKLPEAERQPWQELWADVDNMLAKVLIDDKENSKAKD